MKVTAVLSKAAVTVIKWYKLWNDLNRISEKVLVEEDANTPFIIGPLQTGKFRCLLVAPATANAAPTSPARMTRGRRISRMMVAMVLCQVGVISTNGRLSRSMENVVDSGMATLPMLVASAMTTIRSADSPRML